MRNFERPFTYFFLLTVNYKVILRLPAKLQNCLTTPQYLKSYCHYCYCVRTFYLMLPFCSGNHLQADWAQTLLLWTEGKARSSVMADLGCQGREELQPASNFHALALLDEHELMSETPQSHPGPGWHRFLVWFWMKLMNGSKHWYSPRMAVGAKNNWDESSPL